MHLWMFFKWLGLNSQLWRLAAWVLFFLQVIDYCVVYDHFSQHPTRFKYETKNRSSLSTPLFFISRTKIKVSTDQCPPVILMICNIILTGCLVMWNHLEIYCNKCGWNRSFHWIKNIFSPSYSTLSCSLFLQITLINLLSFLSSKW